MFGRSKKSKDYRGRCGNCHAFLLKDALYCDECGTKKGEGKFKPYENIIRCYYGPPVKITQHCSSCNYKWLKIGVGIKNSSFCPKCKSPSVEVIERNVKDFGDEFGKFFEENEPLQLFTEDEVFRILNLREKYKEKVTLDNEYEVTPKFMKQNGFNEYAKKLADKDLSNREADRINLSEKIIRIIGNENVLPQENRCPKCGGTIACQVKEFERNPDTYEEIIPKEVKKYTLSRQYAGWNPNEGVFMCLQCGHQFKKENSIKKKKTSTP